MIYEQFLPILEVSYKYVRNIKLNSPTARKNNLKAAAQGGLLGTGLGYITGRTSGAIKGWIDAKDVEDKEERKKIIKQSAKKGGRRGALIGGTLGAAAGYLGRDDYTPRQHNRHMQRVRDKRQSIDKHKQWKKDNEEMQKRWDKWKEDVSNTFRNNPFKS